MPQQSEGPAGGGSRSTSDASDQVATLTADEARAAYRALLEGRAIVRLERDFVRVHGTDATTYLQGQLSQDIAAVPVGAGAWSLLLEPNGKVSCWLRLTRVADDDYVLDVDRGFGEVLIARLRRFKLRTHVELDATTRWTLFVNPNPSDADPPSIDAAGTTVRYDLAGVRHHLTTDASAAFADLVPVPLDVYDAWLIENGVPAMGLDLVPGDTIPAEAGQWLIDLSVSFTKGCYTGQELVARIDSRGGNVPHPIRGVIIDCSPDGVPPSGSTVLIDGAERGEIGSVAWSPLRERAVALAVLPRGVQLSDPTQVRAAGAAPGTALPARLSALPMEPA